MIVNPIKKEDSYPERWRDWPDETRQPLPAALWAGKGANSCRATVLKDKRRFSAQPLLVEEVFCVLREVTVKIKTFREVSG